MDVAIVPSERASCRLHAAGKKCACHPCLCLPSFPKVFTSVHFSSSSPNLTFRKNEKKKWLFFFSWSVGLGDRF